MAYRADIEIAVKGAQELKRLTDQINTASKAVDSLNNYIETFGGANTVRSINTLKQAVSEAAAAFNKAALNTDEATGAAQAYTQATRQLNAGLQERIQLLKTIEEQERKQRLASAGVREVSQYGGPIGPGAASSILGGQSSKVEERIQRILAQRQEEAVLQQALLRLEEQKSAELNQQIQKRGELNALAAQEVNTLLQGIRPGTQYGGQIGPGAASSVALSTPLRGRIQQILDERAGRAQLNNVLQDQFEKERQLANSKLDAKALKVQQALDAQAAATAESKIQTDKLSDRQKEFTARTDEAARASRALTAEFIRQQRVQLQLQKGARVTTVELGPGGPGFSGGFTAAQRQAANEQALLRIRQEENKLRRENLNIAQREELFELKLRNLRERNVALEKQRSSRREATSNAIIGGAFPLLFGQGIGASVGGAAGGFAGGLAGGQLGFGLSLVGTAVGASFDALSQSSVDFAKSLRQGGDAATYLENTLGYLDPTLKRQLQNLQNSGQTAAAADLAFQELARTVGKDGAEAFLQLGKNTEAGTLSLKRIAASFIAAGLAANKYFNDIKFGKDKDFTQFLPEQFRPTPVPTPQKETAAAQQRTAELLKNNDILRLQVQLTSISARNDLDRFVIIQKQIVNKEYENELTKISIQLKNREITPEQRRLQITAANLELSKKLGDIERTRVEELTRRQQQAAQAAEEAQRKAEATLRANYEVTKSITLEQLKHLDIIVRNSEFNEGAEMSLRRSLQLSEIRAGLTQEVLLIERKMALQEAQKNGTVKQTNELFKQRIRNAKSEEILQNATTARQIKQLQVEKQLAAARREQGIEDVAIPIQRRQEDVRLGIAGFGQSEQLLEQQRLALEQRRRLEDGELPILREIAALQTEINGGGLAANALAAKEADLDASQRKLGVLREELALLDQLEQRQLRLQQFFASYGQLIQSVSGEIANAVTFGVSEMVRGTKTAEQVFADFLNAVGNALMQAAQTMIAQYIAIGIAKIFAGLGGGSGGGGNYSGAFSSTPGTSFADALKMPSLRAGGGPAVGGTPYLVGERGPELFVPGTSGGVMSNNDLRQSMNSGGSPVLNMSFETTRFGDTEYVSRDQLEAAMSETRRQASRDGAQRGMTMTLDRLQQSPRTRSRLGMR